MPQLDPTWFVSQLFWPAVSFVALYFFLARVALPRIQAVLENRKHTVDADLKLAQGLTSQANHAKQDYERALAEARTKAQQLFDEALLGQKDRADAAQKSMDVKVSNLLASASRDIAAKKQALMEGLLPASTDLAGMIVEKLTQETLAREMLQSIVNDVMKVRS